MGTRGPKLGPTWQQWARSRGLVVVVVGGAPATSPGFYSITPAASRLVLLVVAQLSLSAFSLHMISPIPYLASAHWHTVPLLVPMLFLYLGKAYWWEPLQKKLTSDYD